MKTRVTIWDRIYHLDDSKIEIYQNNDLGSNYIKSNGRVTEIDNNQWIGTIEDNKAPISILDKKSEERIYFYIRTNSRYKPNETRNHSVPITNGLNLIKYEELSEKDKPIRLFLRQESEKKSIRIDIQSVNEREDDSKEQDKYVDNLINAYSDKEIGSILDSNIDEDKRIKSKLKKDPDTIRIDRGFSRVVFKITENSKYSNFMLEGDGKILKLAVGLDRASLKENKKEVQTWQAVKGTDLEQYFCPITSFGPDYRYIIMEEANVKRSNKEMADNIRDILDKKCKVPDDAEAEDISQSKMSYEYDIRPDNIGIYNGNPVLIDYPFGAKIKFVD